MPRLRPWLLLIVATSSFDLLACSGASPRDINYGTKDGADYEAHLPEAGSDSGGSGGNAGAGGSAGGSASDAAATDSEDPASDAAPSDGGTD